MILRSYYGLIELIAKGDTAGNYAAFVDTSGATQKVRYNSSYVEAYARPLGFQSITNICTSKTGYGIAFGTGTAAPKFDDYTLSGDFITGLTGTVVRECVSDTDGNVVITVLATLTNTNSNDVTISEVGYVNSFTGKQPNSTSNVYAYVLFDRTVLDTPVTIPAGGIGQVTYTIRMNYPTA